MPTNIDAIPAPLRELPQWVVWRLEDGDRKMPYNAKTGRQAKSNNSLTWASFEDAVTAYNNGGYEGLGFVFDADDPYVGVDLDDCIDEAGNIADWANDIICTFGSYAEISPSGTGVKIWAEGNIPSNIGNTPYETGAIEMYNKLRYFAVTGNYLHVGDENKPMPLCYVNGPLDTLHSNVLASRRSDKIEYNAAPVDTAISTGGIDEKRLRAYVERVYRDEIAGVVLLDIGKHDNLFRAAASIGGLLHYGIDENEAFSALHNAIVGKAKDIRGADQTIIDGLKRGKLEPRDLSGKLASPQPTFDSEGVPHCPQCAEILFHATSKDVWGCKSCIDASKPFWWQGNGYAPTPITSPQQPAQQATEATTHRRLWYSEEELANIKLPRYIIDGVIVFGETTLIYGPSDAGKTFIVVDMVMRAAQHYPIMYVAGEDMPGVRLRKMVWQQHYQRPPNGNFRMWNSEFSLFNTEQVNEFIVQNLGAGSKLIVFDTLSQCALGADENSNTDMAIVMGNANRIAHEVDAAVIVIHHTTKQENSWRGAGAIKGNTYGFLSVDKPDESIKLECIRIKNSAPFADRYFKLIEIVVDGMFDSKGNPVSSCVIRPSKMVIRSERLSKMQHKILDAIGVLTKSQGKATSADAMAYVEVKGNVFYKPLNVLLDKHYVEKYTGRGVGYCITEAGRDYLIKTLHEGGNVPTDDDISTDLFTVNPIEMPVDGASVKVTNEVTSPPKTEVTKRLTQVDEPSQYKPADGY